MKTLIVGGGSIGARHLKNLALLQGGERGLVEPDHERRARLCRQTDVEPFIDLAQGLEWGPDLVMIATPTHLHLPQALAAARANCHLFIEKPLAAEGAHLTALLREVEKRKLVTLVGCNMRFHPGPAKVKALLDEEKIGRVLFARLHTGSYLPAWRPQADYRMSYSASAEMGGGCILDCIHEIDLARWYVGEVKQVFCLAGHLSSLEMDAEDVASILCRHEGGVHSEIHLDYVQRTYERGCQIVGEEGSIFWDFRDGSVRLCAGGDHDPVVFRQPEEWTLNDMYVDELRHLLDCLSERRQTVCPVGEAAQVLGIALAAKSSMRSGKLTSTEKIF